jgi:restriction system protein
MPRKRNSSALEDLIDIVALLPWWVGVILAVVSYFWLHSVASAPLPIAQSGQMGVMLSQTFYRSLASVGQYLLPFACIAGAAMSAYGRWRRSKLFDSASSSTSAVNDMSWQEFELLVGEAFRRKGYAVAETGGGGADGGVDLLLSKGSEKYLVQCKQWRAYKVGVPVVRELYGAMAAAGAAGGFVVTSGDYTRDARDFAEGRNIELIDGTGLAAMIAVVRQAAPQRPAVAKDEVRCPKCGGEMTKRTARQGQNAGKSFWGCDRFPDCRGIVPID